jgi:hypothetical protein
VDPLHPTFAYVEWLKHLGNRVFYCDLCEGEYGIEHKHFHEMGLSLFHFLVGEQNVRITRTSKISLG